MRTRTIVVHRLASAEALNKSRPNKPLSPSRMDARRTIFRSDVLIRLGVFAGVLICAVAMTLVEQTAQAERTRQSAAIPDSISARRIISLIDDSDAAPELLRDTPSDYRASALTLPTIIDLRLSPVVMMEVTAYCPCKKCCGPRATGITASGKSVDHDDGRFVAADTRVLPFGTHVSIPGYHNAQPVEVIDRGGAIKGNKLDVFFESHEAALRWGRRKVAVTILD